MKISNPLRWDLTPQNERINEWMNEWMNKWMNEWMNEKIEWICNTILFLLGRVSWKEQERARRVIIIILITQIMYISMILIEFRPIWLNNRLCNSSLLLSLRGYCTPTRKLACFVCFLLHREENQYFLCIVVIDVCVIQSQKAWDFFPWIYESLMWNGSKYFFPFQPKKSL